MHLKVVFKKENSFKLIYFNNLPWSDPVCTIFGDDCQDFLRDAWRISSAPTITGFDRGLGS
jgi:hypothetical protein